MDGCIIQKLSIPSDLIGPLNECRAGLDEEAELRRCLDEDGYVFLRGVLNTDDVLAARAEVFGRLQDVGEIKPPAVEGTGSRPSSYASLQRK